MIESVFRAIVTLLTAACLLFPLAGCGSDETGSERPLATETARNGDVFTAADVDLATALIPLEAEAMALVDIAIDRPMSSEARALAEEIELTAPMEIEEMTTWLTSWDEPIPATVRDHVNVGHGDGGEDGTHGHEYADEDLAELAATGDDGFEERWLELLAENHREAIDAARAGEADTAFAPATQLARELRNAHEQRAETIDALLVD